MVQVVALDLVLAQEWVVALVVALVQALVLAQE
jgi:hypothetical protein